MYFLDVRIVEGSEEKLERVDSDKAHGNELIKGSQCRVPTRIWTVYC